MRPHAATQAGLRAFPSAERRARRAGAASFTPTSPFDRHASLPAANGGNVASQHHQAQRNHPETQDRQKAERATDDERAAEPNAHRLASRQRKPAGAEGERMCGLVCGLAGGFHSSQIGRKVQLRKAAPAKGSDPRVACRSHFARPRRKRLHTHHSGLGKAAPALLGGPPRRPHSVATARHARDPW